MSSPGNAVGTLATGAANVQWQIDIPNLSQLIVNLGASGLKQLAMAGVDVHSVGCLLLIANLTPTTIEYRRELNRIRESQRKERIWLYKVLEIGTATNFLADQLLKTRAGENVLALLSALLPLLPEEVFTTVLLKSFERSGVPADSTPGFGQISRIRAALNPFIARTVIKDRVLQYHGLFSQLTSTTTELSSAIPLPQVIPELLCTFHKLITHETPYLLHYHGLAGAAWVAAYACKVLGLQACAILSNGDVISLNAIYDNAQVLIYIESPRQEFSLWQRGNIEDLISVSGPNSMSLEQMTWLISCDYVNFLEYHYPNVQTSGHWENISNNVAERAFLSLSRQIFSVLQKPPTEDLLHYQAYYLPKIQDRLLKILTILGFNPNSRDFYVQRLEDSGGASLSVNLAFDTAPASLSNVVQNAANLSVILAFTNWDTAIRSISAAFFEPAGTVQFTLSDLGDFIFHFDSMDDAILHEIVAYCTSVNLIALKREQLWTLNHIARDFDGTVVLRNSTHEQSLPDLNGFIWKLHPGQISGSGEKCQHVMEETRSVSEDGQAQQTSFAPSLVRDLIRPKNIFTTIAFQCNIAISGDTIWAQPHVYVNESTILQVSIRNICKNIIRMYVSNSCPHPTGSALNLYKHLQKDNICAEGFCLNSTDLASLWNSSRRSCQTLFILQQVDGNTLGQWLSCSAVEQSMVLIWQRYSCLECVIRNLPRGKDGKRLTYVIIADSKSKAPKPEEAQDISSSGHSDSE